MRRMISRTLAAAAAAAAAAALLLAACGSGTATTGAGGGSTSTGTSSSGTGARTPKVHRATETACNGARPPGGGGFGDPMDKCMMDADCTAGTNGRCVAALGQPTFCSYDQCAADADCGSATVCECRNPAQYNANICTHGTCRLDADCGAGGFCSPSAVTVYPNCLTGIDQGSIGYFCHQPADECVDDTDCGAMGSVCLFRVSAMHWVCHTLLCTK